MQLTELLTRLRNTPGTTSYAKALTLAESIEKASPDELRAAWAALAPWALRELDRRTLKSDPHTLPIPVGNSGVRKDPYEWRRADFALAKHYLGKIRAAADDGFRTLARVERAFKGDRETYRQVRARLSPDLAEKFEKWAGIKKLAA